MVVDTAQQVLNDQYKLYDRTKGAQGFERRDAVKTTGEGDSTKVRQGPAARRRCSPPSPRATSTSSGCRPRPTWPTPPRRRGEGKVEGKNADLYAFQSADYYFLYGQFADARSASRRSTTSSAARAAGATRRGAGSPTWPHLERNIPASRKLAEASKQKPCAITARAEARPRAQGQGHHRRRLLHRRLRGLPEGREDAATAPSASSSGARRRRSTRSRSRTRPRATRRPRPP